MYNKGDREYVDIYVCVIVGTRAQSVVSLTSDHFINFWYLLLLLWWELASIINLTLQIIIRKGIGKPCDCGQLQHFNLNQQWLIFFHVFVSLTIIYYDNKFSNKFES